MRYELIIYWSDEDSAYIGSCPDLYLGGVCHSQSEESCYSELWQIVCDEIVHRLANFSPLPKPEVRATRDLDLASA